jgi:hypothetical protein
MALEFVKVDKETAMYTSSERLYLDKSGNIVPEDSPHVNSLLVAAGGQITEADARKYGLLPPEPETKRRAADDQRGPFARLMGSDVAGSGSPPTSPLMGFEPGVYRVEIGPTGEVMAVEAFDEATQAADAAPPQTATAAEAGVGATDEATADGVKATEPDANKRQPKAADKAVKPAENK